MLGVSEISEESSILQEKLPHLETVVDNTDKNTAYKISRTEIGDLLVFERRLYEDDRGFYQEFARTEAIEEILGRKVNIKQWALSYNKPGVLRGLHAESQDKLVTPITGIVFIAVADIRPDSPTFGKSVTFTLDQRDPLSPRKTIIIANGLANSFLTLGDQPVEYFYAVTETYKTSEGKNAVRWDDPDLAIKWPMKPEIISSDDASKHPFLREKFPEKFR